MKISIEQKEKQKESEGFNSPVFSSEVQAWHKHSSFTKDLANLKHLFGNKLNYKYNSNKLF